MDHFAPTEPSRFANFADISTVSGGKIVSPLEKLANLESPTLQDKIEAIIFWTGTQFGVQEFVSAQNDFQLSCGKIYHEDIFYHQRMSYFLDYFIFERKMNVAKQAAGTEASFKTPFEHFIESDYFARTIANRNWVGRFLDLEKFIHSLFLIERNSSKRLRIQDLLTGARFEFPSNESLVFRGFDPGIVLQGYVFAIGNAFELSQGLILHPPQVYRVIKKNLKKERKDPNFDHMKHLTTLAKKNLAFIRHKNLDARKIYAG